MQRGSAKRLLCVRRKKETPLSFSTSSSLWSSMTIHSRDLLHVDPKPRHSLLDSNKMTMYCSRETRSSTPFNDSIAGSSRRSSRQKCDLSLSICRLEMEKKEPLLYYSDSLPLLVKTMNKSSNGTSRTIHLKDFPSLTGIKRNGRGRRRRIEDSISTSSLCSMAIDVPLKIEPLPNEMPLEVLFIQEEREKDDWDLFPREGIEHRRSSYLRTSIPTSTSVERASSLITETSRSACRQ